MYVCLLCLASNQRVIKTTNVHLECELPCPLLTGSARGCAPPLSSPRSVNILGMFPACMHVQKAHLPKQSHFDWQQPTCFMSWRTTPHFCSVHFVYSGSSEPELQCMTLFCTRVYTNKPQQRMQRSQYTRAGLAAAEFATVSTSIMTTTEKSMSQINRRPVNSLKPHSTTRARSQLFHVQTLLPHPTDNTSDIPHVETKLLDPSNSK